MSRSLALRLICGAVMVACLGVSARAASPAEAASTTYYLSPHGKDTGACSSAAPCATLYYVTTPACHSGWSVQPGDAINLLGGTYATTANVSLCGASVTNPLGYVNHLVGSASAPIVIRGPSNAVLQRAYPAPDASQSFPLVTVFDSSYVTLSGFHVTGMKGRGDYHSANTTPLYGEVDVEDAGPQSNGTFVTVSGLTVNHAGFTCIKQEDDESYETITGNHLTDCGATGNAQEHGIYLSGAHNTVSNNSIVGTSGCGIQTYQTSDVPVSNETITGNTISNARLAGIYVYQGPSTLAGNVVSGAYAGIEAWASGGNITIAENVFKFNKVVGLNMHSDADGTYSVLNNTFYKNGKEEMGIAGNDSVEAIVLNNIYYGNGDGVFNGTWRSGSVTDYNDYFATSGAVDGSHSVTANPQFVSPGLDFHLRSSSPDLGTGTKVGLPYTPPGPNKGALGTSAVKSWLARHSPHNDSMLSHLPVSAVFAPIAIPLVSKASPLH